MRGAARAITATTTTRPQPPHAPAGADPPQPGAAPASQHAHATTRAQQPAKRKIRLDHSTIVCDDHHDDLLKASRGLSLHPTKSSARGPSNNTITTIMSPRTPPRSRPSPPNVTLEGPRVTTKRVAQHLDGRAGRASATAFRPVANVLAFPQPDMHPRYRRSSSRLPPIGVPFISACPIYGPLSRLHRVGRWHVVAGLAWAFALKAHEHSQTPATHAPPRSRKYGTRHLRQAWHLRRVIHAAWMTKIVVMVEMTLSPEPPAGRNSQ